MKAPTLFLKSKDNFKMRYNTVSEIGNNLLLIKQRNIILSLYLFTNVYFTFVFIDRGRLGGDFRNAYASNTDSLLISLGFILSSWFFLSLVFKYLSLLEVKKINFFANRTFDYFFLILTIVYFYGVLKGYIPGGEIRPLFFSLFLVIQPDYLLLIYLFYRVSSVSIIYFLVLGLVVFSFMLNGRTAIFIILLPLFNIYHIVNNNRFSIFKNLVLIIPALFIYPFIRVTKYIIPNYLLSGGNDFSGFMSYYYDSFIANNFIDNYVNTLNSSLERFQHVGNISFLMDHPNISIYVSSFDYKFIQSGLIGYIYTLFSGERNVHAINSIFTSYFANTFDWSTHTGIIGIYFIDHLLFIQSIFVILVSLFLAVIISKVFAVSNALYEINWLSMILYLFHGWYGTFLVHVQSLLFFLIIIIIFKFFSEKQEYNCN